MTSRSLSLTLILFLCSTTHAAVHIWTGATSNRFSDDTNWRGGSPAGDPAAELSFPGEMARRALQNDIPNLTLRSIEFTGPDYSISGGAISFINDAEVIHSTIGMNSIACDVVLSGGVTFLVIGGTYDNGELVLSGTISGTGPVAKIGPGTMMLAGTGANTYTGETSVPNGRLRLNKSDGINAVPGNLRVGTGGRPEYAYLDTIRNEQIPDTVTVHVGESGELEIGGVERIGPMVIEGGASMRTSTTFSPVILQGTLILGGDIEMREGFGTADFLGSIGISGIRTVTTCDNSSIDFFGLFEQDPGSGLILRALNPNLSTVEVRQGSYHGPTVIDGARAIIDNPNTAVRLRRGTFSGSVASLVTEGGIVAGVSTKGDLHIGSATTVRLGVSSEISSLTAGGVFDLGRASLDFVGTSLPRVLGHSYVVGQNKGEGPIRGYFLQAPEGTMLGSRFLLSYTGGDGNDLTLTEVGRYLTNISFSPSYQSVMNGESVTLSARVTTERQPSIASKGSVTFRENDSVIDTVAVNSSGVASITLQPHWGTHTYTAKYGGSEDLSPSATSSTTVRVSPPKPVIASVDPSNVQSGTTVTATVRGTDFLPDGNVAVSSNFVQTTYVSSTEVRFTWAIPHREADETMQLSYGPPSPWTERSNTVPFLVKANPAPKSPLIFEPRAISGPVAPGGGATWLSVARRRLSNGVPAIEQRVAITPDSDHDGVARWEQPDDVPQLGVWLMTDWADGKIISGKPDGAMPAPLAFPKASVLRDPEGRYSHLILPLSGFWGVLWIRPGTGAWLLNVSDSSGLDLDGASNGLLVFNVSQMKSISQPDDKPPAGIERGDVLLGESWLSEDWFGDRVDDHLQESDGPGTIRFAGVSIADETSGKVRITLLRTGGTSGTISVDWTTTDNTAKSGVVYDGRAGTAAFGPGEILQTIEIPLINDSVYSGATAFNVVLSRPAGTTITGPASKPITIRDDEPPPQLVGQNMTTTEGDDGTHEVLFNVTISGATRLPVTARWDSRLEPDGGSHAAGTLTFVPGGPTTQTIAVRYNANRLPEEDRIYSVSITNVQNALPERVTQSLTVVDDDFADVSILDASISEAKDYGWVVVAIDERSTKPVTFKYATAAGSAIAGTDFVTTSGTGSIGGLDRYFLIQIPIVADPSVEGDEWFSVTLSGVKNARVRRDSASVVILDDESNTIPAIAVAPVALAESPFQPAKFRFQLSFSSPQEVRFRAATASGTATGGADFQSIDQTIVIPSGTMNFTLDVPLINDAQTEGTETFSIVLSEPVGATIATPSATATIFDDDRVTDPNAVSISGTGLELVEGDAGPSMARFTIQLSRAASSTITVPYATADAAAVAPADYARTAGTISFAPGETTKVVEVAVSGDKEHELDETFTLVLGNPTNATVAVRALTCRIRNDDAAPIHRRSAGH
jgi:autotransporter-associated beta strand protein